MIKITQDIVTEARKILASWRRASKETRIQENKDFQLREVANILWVDHERLKKKL